LIPTCGSGSRIFAVIESQFRRFWSGSQTGHRRSKSWRIIPNWSRKRPCRHGDRRILDYAAANDFILVSTDSDFEGLLRLVPAAKVVILRSCDYPTEVAAKVLRRNAMRLADLATSQDRLIVLDQ
jgi:predicted nuclease of predicted toxin-antitoxin system